MCQKCIEGYPANLSQNQHNGFPWNSQNLLGTDPDHGWRAASLTETAAAQGLNAQFPGLNLVRPPNSGMGDFVALNGAGHHFDHKTLTPGGAALQLVNDNIEPTLNGPFQPFIIVDATTILPAQQQNEINQLNNLLNDAQRDRIIWWPLGPNGAATALPPGVNQAWQGPDDVDLSDSNLFSDDLGS